MKLGGLVIGAYVFPAFWASLASVPLDWELRLLIIQRYDWMLCTDSCIFVDIVVSPCHLLFLSCLTIFLVWFILSCGLVDFLFIPSNTLCRADLVVRNSFRLFLSWKTFIFLSVTTDSFSGDCSRGWQLSCRTWVASSQASWLLEFPLINWVLFWWTCLDWWLDSSLFVLSIAFFQYILCFNYNAKRGVLSDCVWLVS